MSIGSERAETMTMGIVDRSRIARVIDAPFIVGSMRSSRTASAPCAVTNSKPSRPSANDVTV
jgi:Cys-tRNA synthase (O-phospho-L-seryl-tRNA:Cys-tRNA synthase)